MPSSIVFPIIVVVAGMSLSGCDAPHDETVDRSEEREALAEGEDATLSHMRREHEMAGRVVSLNKGSREVVIEHEPVPSLELPSDRTQFLVTDTAEISTVKPGDNVEFVLVRDNFGRYVIREIRPAR